VDGTTLEAWASLKSFQPRDGAPPDDPGSRQPDGQFKRQQRRKNDTHMSRTDPEARLYQKADGKQAVLAYQAHVLLDNRHGLVPSACHSGRWLRGARGCHAVCWKPAGVAGARAGRIAAITNFLSAVRRLALTPHVAVNAQYDAIDGRVTWTPGTRSETQTQTGRASLRLDEPSDSCASCANVGTNG